MYWFLLAGHQQIHIKPSLILEGARKQLVHPADYTPGYVRLKYPGGDVPASTGVCTDVVIRALRHAGLDLQKAIHEDAKLHPKRYPHIKSPDANIDHRRVPNQAAYFAAHGRECSLTTDFRPGDFVYWKLDNGLDHIGILSARRAGDGSWFAIHNISRTAEENVLHRWKIVGHYRL